MHSKWVRLCSLFEFLAGKQKVYLLLIYRIMSILVDFGPNFGPDFAGWPNLLEEFRVPPVHIKVFLWSESA